MTRSLSWKFRKSNITIALFTLFINNVWEGWGFDLFRFEKNLQSYSLLKLTWDFPNSSDKSFVFSGDFLFLRTPLHKSLVELTDTALYSDKLSKWSKIKLKVLNYLFSN